MKRIRALTGTITLALLLSCGVFKHDGQCIAGEPMQAQALGEGAVPHHLNPNSPPSEDAMAQGLATSAATTAPMEIREANPAPSKAMSLFEQWYLLLVALQNLLMLGTIISAVYIGVKQNQINHSLLDLNYNVSPEIIYTEGRLNIHNKGHSNLYLWGTKFANNPSVDQIPRLISPGSSYYLLTNGVEPEIKAKLGANGTINVPFEVYVTNERQRKFIINNLIFFVMTDGRLSAHTQTLGVTQSSW